MELNASQDMTKVDIHELVEAGAHDSEVFYRAFFPGTFRQPSPGFHREIDAILDDPSARYCNIIVFRGGAKTTKLRAFTAKRIAYGLAHTVLYIGKSEGHAVRSIRWLKRQVEHNRLYAQTFGLTKGKSWTDTEIEIKHRVAGFNIRVLGMGVTGSVRGINEDDFRPDLEVLDDVLDEENCATLEQRTKISNLVYGALEPSLAPEVDAPDAKMVALNTPQQRDDFAMKAMGNSMWRSARYGLWTPETEDLPVHLQESRWPERLPTDKQRAKKRAAVERNDLSVWLREYEVKLINPETTKFNPAWLRYFDLEPEGGVTVLSIDPVPPPKASAIEKGDINPKKDFEALAAVRLHRGRRYVLETSANRGHEPDWTVSEFFRMVRRWGPTVVVVESVAYQATLQWLLRKAMEHARIWVYIKDTNTIKNKVVRITDGLKGISAGGQLYVRREQTDLIEQFTDYPGVTHDDVLEAVANACIELEEWTEHDNDDEELIGEMDSEKPMRLLGVHCP